MNRILVIDDERPTLKMFSLFLRAYGFDMLAAESGREGLEIFEREKPPLVLTDVKMPGMDGLGVLKRIKEISPESEVIVVTGHGDIDLALKTLRLGAADFIAKPIDRTSLEAALSRARERLDLAREKREEIQVQETDHALILNFRGHVNAPSEPFLARAMTRALEANKPLVLFNFNPNISVNGVGMTLLSGAIDRAEQAGKTVRIAGLPGHFRQVFEAVGIASRAEIHDSLDAAMALP
ncbi:MAG: response regulator [Deltaproteobacteria bacterium]|nr:response regulator [Deltaproteobacteria bacterium]